MNYTSHIKAAHLKDLLLKEHGTCEEKLDEINKLLGLPQLSQTSSEQSESITTNEQSTSEQVDERQKSIDEILKDVKGKDWKLAKGLLRRIEFSDLISWNYETLEIIVEQKTILHSNIKLLIEKVVRLASPCLPVALLPFILALTKKPIPLNFFQDSDSLSIREGLLKITKPLDAIIAEKPEQPVEPSVDQPAEETAEEAVEQPVEEAVEESVEEAAEVNNTNNIRNKKRQRNNLQDPVPYKQQKQEDEETTLVKGVANADQEDTSRRRSQRLQLKPHLKKTWKSMH